MGRRGLAGGGVGEVRSCHICPSWPEILLPQSPHFWGSGLSHLAQLPCCWPKTFYVPTYAIGPPQFSSPRPRLEMEARAHTCRPDPTPPPRALFLGCSVSGTLSLAQPFSLGLGPGAWAARGHCGSPMVLEVLGPVSPTQNTAVTVSQAEEGDSRSLGSLVKGGEKLLERAQPAELAS